MNRPENEGCINIIFWILRAVAVLVICVVVLALLFFLL
jgi:hypothetical protein